MRKKIFFIFLALQLTHSLYSQNSRMDTLLQKEIEKSLTTFLPDAITKNGESSILLVKVEICKIDSSTKIYFLNEERDFFKDYVSLALKKVKFNKFFNAGELLIIPIFFETIYENKKNKEEEFTKVSSSIFKGIYESKEAMFQVVKFMKPIKISTLIIPRAY